MYVPTCGRSGCERRPTLACFFLLSMFPYWPTAVQTFGEGEHKFALPSRSGESLGSDIAVVRMAA